MTNTAMENGPFIHDLPLTYLLSMVILCDCSQLCSVAKGIAELYPTFLYLLAFPGRSIGHVADRKIYKSTLLKKTNGLLQT